MIRNGASFYRNEVEKQNKRENVKGYPNNNCDATVKGSFVNIQIMY
jgi:acylphosphatase